MVVGEHILYMGFLLNIGGCPIRDNMNHIHAVTCHSLL